jgi:hypothetical protein
VISQNGISSFCINVVVVAWFLNVIVCVIVFLKTAVKKVKGYFNQNRVENLDKTQENRITDTENIMVYTKDK